MRYTISVVLASLVASTAAAEAPRVVADLPPVHSLASQVMGDAGHPALLMDRGGDAHDFQLRPSQAAAVAGADLVVWTGEAMAPWLARAIVGTGTKGHVLTLLDAPETLRRPFGAGGVDDDHGHDEDHGHGHTQGHDHGDFDPHAWLDPRNAAAWLALIAADLGRLDPANASTYTANAEQAAAGIAAMEAEIAALLTPLRDRPFVTFHNAYGYFVARFGLSQAGTIALGDAASPGAQRLSALRAEVREGGATCVFPEANHDPRLAAQLAEATGARLGPALDPEGAALDPGAGLYAAMMRGLAAGLAECLGQAAP